MSSTFRRPFLHGRCCARWRHRTYLWRIAIGVAFWALLWPTMGQPAAAIAANADEEFASSGLYLQSGSGHFPGPFVGAFELNNLLGAQRFYNAGYTGTNSVMANIEAGSIWNGHETLAHVGLIPTSGALGEVDRHATWVAMVLGGRPGGANPGEHQRGIAPDAQIFSGAIATSWPNSPSFPRYTTSFNFSTSGSSTYGPYRAAFMTGIAGPGGTRTADVINSSWISTGGITGSDRLAGTLDALANASGRTLFTAAAGNTTPSGEGPNRVGSPASGYNNMSVASLRPNGGAFDLPSTFSNGGPSNYFDPTTGTVNNARQVIDIAAPGENFSTAYYGGETGGNGAGLSGPPNGPAGGPDWYSRDRNGTSFAAPTVAGGAALLYDAAYDTFGANPDARDARVVKAVLMNSADKTQGWNNGQLAHPNGNGGVLTTQGLDNRVGTGRLNLDRAFDQMLGGTADVPGIAQGPLGAVEPVGWDFGVVGQGIINDYLFGTNLIGGSDFTATLTWFRDRLPVGTTNFSDASYDNLDLELWDVLGGAAAQLISTSMSRYNNSEHFHFAIPATGQYMLRVRWTEELFDLVGDTNSEHYGLAWAAVAVPEPATVVLLFAALAPAFFFRHRCVKKRTMLALSHIDAMTATVIPCHSAHAACVN